MPTLGDDVRAIVGGVVPGMCDGILRSWRSAPALRIDLSAHGCVPWHDVDELVCSTLRDLVLPGFQVLGVDTAPTRRWFDTIPAGAPTHSLA